MREGRLSARAEAVARATVRLPSILLRRLKPASRLSRKIGEATLVDRDRADPLDLDVPEMARPGLYGVADGFFGLRANVGFSSNGVGG